MKMKFCPKCGSIMVPEKNKNGKIIYKCKNCGYVEEDNNIKIIFVENIRNENISVEAIDKKIDTLPKVKIKCPKCGNEEAYYWTMQTRAGDEAETRFYRCTKCGYTWREYD